MTYAVIHHFNDTNARINKCRYRILAKGLTLRVAQRMLLGLYNDCQTDRAFAPNWGIAVCQTANRIDKAYPTDADGLRCFDDDGDSYVIAIDEEDDDNEND